MENQKTQKSQYKVGEEVELTLLSNFKIVYNATVMETVVLEERIDK